MRSAVCTRVHLAPFGEIHSSRCPSLASPYPSSEPSSALGYDGDLPMGVCACVEPRVGSPGSSAHQLQGHRCLPNTQCRAWGTDGFSKCLLSEPNEWHAVTGPCHLSLCSFPGSPGNTAAFTAESLLGSCACFQCQEETASAETNPLGSRVLSKGPPLCQE